MLKLTKRGNFDVRTDGHTLIIEKLRVKKIVDRKIYFHNLVKIIKL